MLNIPTHIAIIMDGNGRWAISKNKPRIFGHKNGVKNINEIVKCAFQNKIKYLTLFAFSVENFNRPPKEVNFLINLFDKSINKNLQDKLIKNNICFRWIGFKEKLDSKIISKLENLMNLTKKCNGLNLTIAFNYGGIQDLQQAAKKQNTDLKNALLTKDLPAVDLLIRTGNEKRISNFLIYDLSYAEIIFDKTMWPDYHCENFKKNLIEYSKRKRRFGKITNE